LSEEAEEYKNYDADARLATRFFLNLYFFWKEK
jgi:hypothetical protein